VKLFVLLANTLAVTNNIIPPPPTHTLPVTFATMLQIIRYIWTVEMKVKSVICPTCLDGCIWSYAAAYWYVKTQPPSILFLFACAGNFQGLETSEFYYIFPNKNFLILCSVDKF